MFLVRFLVIAVSLALAACDASPRETAEKRLRTVGLERLRRDAALLYKENFASRTLDFIALRSNKWPESFRSLSPLRVGLYLDGITITLENRSRGEAGLYVIPASMDQQPKDGPGTRFEPMAEGLYWFTFEG